MTPIIECVPNFSEGRNPLTIQAITNEIESVEAVRLLNVDPGKATNRTVVTFVGPPQAVVEAAFLAIRKAGELIDMRQHYGRTPKDGSNRRLSIDTGIRNFNGRNGALGTSAR